MLNQYSLSELKGAPLSIVIALMMKGNRTVSVFDLAATTGYNQKTIRTELKKLTDQQIICRPRSNCYQLMGDVLQLPLYWDEKTEPVPAAEKSSNNVEVFSTLLARIEDLEARVRELETEKISHQMEKSSTKAEKISIIDYPEANRKVELFSEKVEKCSEKVEKSSTYEEAPLLINNNNTPDNLVGWLVDIDNNQPNENTVDKLTTDDGKNPETIWKAALQQLQGTMGKDSFGLYMKNSELICCSEDHWTVGVMSHFALSWCRDRLTESLEKILSGMTGEKQTVSFVEKVSCNKLQASCKQVPSKLPDHHEDVPELIPVPEDPHEAALAEICNDYLVNPTGINYSKKEMETLISCRPDPDVLRFILPNLSSFTAARTWCDWDVKQAQAKLLTKNKVTGAARSEMVNNPNVSLEMIFSVFQELDPDEKNREGKGIYRIKQLAEGGKTCEL